ncbi:MAG: DUF2203 domain-containing protein [Actinomycetota bacterium]
MSDKHLYTLESASLVLSEVERRLLRLREAYRKLAGHTEDIEEQSAGNGSSPRPEEWLVAARNMAKELKWLSEQGILIRDVEQGLIDFPSEREGEEILLCWRLGENSIEFWHYADEGFDGRQPL